MQQLFRFLAVCWCLLAGLGELRAAPAEAPPPHPRVHVKYWEKWTDFERDAMQAVVDDFNASQDRIFVDHITVSSVNQKTLIATAGGNPPDLAGVWANDVVDFADKEALIPLDELARGTSVTRERFLPLYWDMGVYDGKLYGAVSVPVVTGLHWNKALFRKAGLDPDRPPRTIAELDAYAQKLTLTRDGQIEQIGFLPSQPPWWPFFWGHFFGGRLWDGGDNVLFDSAENVQAFTWIQGYAKRHGIGALSSFSASFGNFASAQDPFMSGKLAMIFQGVWMANYIERYAPSLEWGAAPFPPLREGDDPVTMVDSDMFVIPRGSRHPREAFEFIRFVSEQRQMEKLCLGQRKNSPLRDVSEDFLKRHRHPNIRMFQKLAASPRAASQPKMSVWSEYRTETTTTFQRVWLLQASPERALGDAKARIQKSWDRDRRRKATPPSEGLRFAPWLLLALFLACVAAIVARERAKLVRLGGARRSARSNASLAKGLAFLSPWTVGLFLFIGFPVMSTLVYSFCDYSVLSTPRFVGLVNYAELFRDEVFWIALENTLVYAALAVPIGLGFAFWVALLLDAKVRGTSLYRTLIFLPSLMPVVASAMVWLWMYNGQHGILNYFLGKLSFGWIDPVPWLTDPRTALPSLVLMSVWSVGQTVVILLAAMQDVPTSVYEAAELDGARFWHKVRHITLPLTSPVIYFNAIVGLIAALQVFSQPFIMTAGGPARATLSYSLQIYNNAFLFLRMGYASAMSWILFLIILVLTVIAVRIGKTRIHYTGA